MMDHININHSILHILDNSITLPVFSDYEYEKNEEIDAFLSNHIKKIFKDAGIKKTSFGSDNNVLKNYITEYVSDRLSFVDISKKLSERIYHCMKQCLDIPSADVVVLDFQCDDDKYLGLIKFNYKEAYIHAINQLDGGRENYIIKQKTAIPSDSQVIDECFFISLTTSDIIIKEKKYRLEEDVENYLSKRVLGVNESISDKEKVRIVTNVSKKLIKEHYDDVAKIGEAKKIMTESIEEGNVIDVEEICDKIFPYSETIKAEYMSKMREHGISDKVVPVKNTSIKKANRMQKIVTSDGIEINIPVAYMTGTDKVEFITNQDGTISIILKNIEKIEDK